MTDCFCVRRAGRAGGFVPSADAEAFSFLRSGVGAGGKQVKPDQWFKLDVLDQQDGLDAQEGLSGCFCSLIHWLQRC